METVQAAPVFALLDEWVKNRRSARHFTAEPVPAEIIDNAIAIAAQAPSGYSLQPWRFLIVTEPDLRRRLQCAAHNQPKIGEAPVMIIAFGQREGWRENADEIFRKRAARLGLDANSVAQTKRTAADFITSLSPIVWLNRQVMIAFTVLMLAIEAQGWDTAPMEGFDGAAVREAFELPADAEVVALLAVGRALPPDPPHLGRLPVSRIAFRERHGHPLIPFNESES